MKKYAITLISLSTLMFTACSSHKYSWVKTGVSSFDMQNTLAKCNYDVGLAKVVLKEKDAMVKNCMIAQGYRYK